MDTCVYASRCWGVLRVSACPACERQAKQRKGNSMTVMLLGCPFHLGKVLCATPVLVSHLDSCQVWHTPSKEKQMSPWQLHRTYGQCHSDVLDLDWSPDSLFLAVASKDITLRRVWICTCIHMGVRTLFWRRVTYGLWIASVALPCLQACIQPKGMQTTASH